MRDNLLMLNEGRRLIGRYKSLTVNFPIEMVPVGGTGNKPSHDVYSGGVKLGAAWEKTTRDTGEVFYSLTLDDPSFPQQLNLAAFPSREDGEANCYNLVWSRPKAKEAA